MTWEQAVAELKDTLIVVTEIQRRQAEVQKLQAQELDALREAKALHEAQMAHIRQNLDEATDKLNGIIGWLDDFTRRKN
jgi:hypothetical protein